MLVEPQITEPEKKRIEGGASSGVEFSKARALGRKVSRAHAHALVGRGARARAMGLRVRSKTALEVG